jgi:ATP-dependent exoDNAse (exonuclease V) alpha subunit
MMRRNLKKKIVNGSLGTVTGFVCANIARDQLAIGKLPESVTVKFDDLNDVSQINVTTITFQGKGKKSKTARMVSLVLSWSVTIHKTQG